MRKMDQKKLLSEFGLRMIKARRVGGWLSSGPYMSE